MTALLEYLYLTALLEYINLLNRYSRGPPGVPFRLGQNAPVAPPCGWPCRLCRIGVIVSLSKKLYSHYSTLPSYLIGYLVAWCQLSHPAVTSMGNWGSKCQLSMPHTSRCAHTFTSYGTASCGLLVLPQKDLHVLTPSYSIDSYSGLSTSCNFCTVIVTG